MSSSDKTAEYAITADPTGFQAGMDKAVQAAKEAQNQIAASMGSLGDAFNLVKGHLAAFTALLGGGKMFKDGIAETVQLTGETVKLSKALGISMTDASGLNVALKGIGSSADVYTDANAKLVKQVRTNEEGVKAMGVATRGANGEYLNGKQLMMNAIEALKGYKEGTDRNLAAQVLFGKGAADAASLLKLTEKGMADATIKAAALGLVIGPEQAAKTKAYKESLNDVKLVMEGIMNTIGQAAMPVFTELAQWFSAAGPSAVGVFKEVFSEVGNLFQIVMDIAKELWSDLKDVFNGIVQIITDAVGGDIAKNFEFWKSLMTVVQVAALGLKNGIVIGFEIIRGEVLALIEYLKMFAAVAVAAMHLDWAGVKSAWSDGTQAIEKVVSDSAARIVAKSAKTAEQMQLALMGGAPKAPDAAPKAPTGKSYTDPKAGAADGKEVSNSLKAQFAVIKAELDGQLAIQKEHLTEAQEAYNDAYKHNLLTTTEFYAAKLAIEQQGVKGAIAIKEEELRETQALQAKALATGKQSDVLSLKAQEIKLTAELTVLNAQAFNTEVKNTRELTDALLQKKTAMQEIARVSQQQVGSAQIDRERIMLDQAKALHEISDAQAIQAEAALQERLYQIDLQALRDKEQQFDGNLEKIAANNAAIEQLERQHQTKIIQIKSQATVEANKDMTAMNAGIRSSLESSMASMMQGTMTLQKGMQAVNGAILQGFTQMISKKVTAWAMGETAQTGATIAGDATRTTSSWMAATQSVMANAWAAVKNIAMKAWEVAASVYAAIAAIPYVGPFLAPVMAGAATVAVLGFAANIASAEGGYDIPAGVNPMTQLHQKEMVLPEGPADVIRSLSSGGGGGGDSFTVHVNATDAQSVARLFRDNGQHIVTALKAQRRNFAY
ncbi:MAG TPA: hypothetical protein VIK56_09345 [Rhodoferax sp.]